MRGITIYPIYSIYQSSQSTQFFLIHFDVAAFSVMSTILVVREQRGHPSECYEMPEGAGGRSRGFPSSAIQKGRYTGQFLPLQELQ